MHAITGEGQTGINKHDVVAVFEHAGVLADLMQATERDNPQGWSGGLVGTMTV
jgi:hypothetical protein